MAKGRLSLLDTAVVGNGRGDKLRPAVEAAWGQRYSAQRYIFDIEASRRVGEMMGTCVDLMVDNIEFARTPYPTCYFELDARAMWAAWRPDQAIRDSHDERVGFLVHKGTVVVMAAGPVYHTTVRGVEQVLIDKPQVCGLSFRINRPQTIPFAKLTALAEPLAVQCKTAYVFGGQRGVDKPGDYRFDHFDERTWVFLPDLPGAWTHDQVAAHFDIMPAFMTTPPTEVLQLCFLGGGDPMLLTTCLLLLNQPSRFVGLTEVKREHGIYKGKRQTFKEHHIVTVHLDQSKKVRRMLHVTDRASPIAHPVEGHWKHYNKSESCNHHHPDQRQAWEPVGPERTISGDYKRYWCPLCLQRRTWTEHFQKGNAGEGFATNEHVVTR